MFFCIPEPRHIELNNYGRLILRAAKKIAEIQTLVSENTNTNNVL